VSGSAGLRAVAHRDSIPSVPSPREPVLLVLDEAPNICPPEPANQMEDIATDYIVRIADEGLKYGLRLLLASQRPAKIHTYRSVKTLSSCG
jgi:hypothetical protein